MPLLVRHGHKVTAITRSQLNLDTLTAQGAAAEVCDVFERKRLNQLVEEASPDVVIHQLTSIPSQMHPRRIGQEMAATNRLRIEGTTLLVEAAKAAGTRRIVTQSIAFLYRPDDRAPATEKMPLYRDAPAGFANMVDAVDQCERITLQTPGIVGTVLRYGYFYGPGTIYAADGRFAKEVQRRRVPLVGRGNGIFSFIHVADAAGATLAALTEEGGGIYNIVDDEPAYVSEWLPYYAELLGAKLPYRVPRFVAGLVGGSYLTYLMTQQRGASNSLAKKKLGWRPHYASWRDGFRADFEAS